jgi:HEAT repeat protein
VGYDVEALLQGLASPEAGDRLKAAYDLEAALQEELEQGRADWADLVAAVLPALIAGLGDSHKGVQVHTGNCVEFLSYQSPEVLPALREALRGADRWQAWGAALVGARMGLWCEEMGPALRDAMGAADRDVRWAAAGFCLQLGRKYTEAVDTVRAALASENPLARKMAAYCLGAMGQYAQVEADLAARLDDPERDVRRAVILGIDKLPQVSGAVQERVRAMRSDSDAYVRRTAAAVAAKFGGIA